MVNIHDIQTERRRAFIMLLDWLTLFTRIGHFIAHTTVDDVCLWFVD